MRDIEVSKRMVAKTPEQWFLRVMQEGYNFSPKMSESLLAETELCFQGQKKTKIGQQKVILVKRKEKHGRPIKELEKVETLWTIDAGLEDEQYLCEYGKTELRQKRIQRLLQEATEQNGIATQEDLARVLHVSVRTIKRDFSVMKQAGIELVTRGYDEGVGRGQTHKSEIIQRWMNGESYDQLVRNTGHSSSSIQRYIQKYMQVVELSKQGFETDDIGRLAQIGRGIVAQYLLIYEEAKKEPATEKWIENQRKRIFYSVQRTRALKKGVL
ncbi:DUF1670 domain-containing protein [bacterium]|jgi:hypothetical protein|nr:DUF1670 domain-containing protein [bacterium]